MTPEHYDRHKCQEHLFSLWNPGRRGDSTAEMLKQTILTVLVLLACWVALMQGLPTSGRERCFCRRSGVPAVNMDRVMKVEYYKSTSSCGQEELLVFLRNNRRRCLNINGEQGRRIKLAIMEKNSSK
ncbi:C-X-C motif chemokine 11-1-like [Erythrolamprus reginae]|uniref:C-X-C motif chemokine 11-1-like n=1 Tax=Erythrolamprus reginae TaxID=121349 RepID=UPI00396C9048